MQTINFIVNGLYKNSGGLPKAIIKRSKLLTDKDFNIVLYTMAYQTDLDALVNDYIYNGKLHPKTTVKRIYDLATAAEKINLKDTYIYQKIHLIYLKKKYYSEYDSNKNQLILFKDKKKIHKKARISYYSKNKTELKEIAYYDIKKKGNGNVMVKRNQFANKKTKLIAIIRGETLADRFEYYIEDDKVLARVTIQNNKFIKTKTDGKLFNSNGQAYAYLLNKAITPKDVIFGEYRDENLRYLPGTQLDDVIATLNTKKELMLFIILIEIIVVKNYIKIM